MKNKVQLTQAAAAVLFASSLPATALAQNAVRGKQLYDLSDGAPLTCATAAACHGANPAANLNKVLDGANNPAAILAAITNVPIMGFLSAYINAQDAADLAAYLANPSGAPAPAPAPAGLNRSATALTFNYQTVGTTSAPLTLTLTNSGSAPISITQVGASPTPEFTATGNCVGSLAAGAQCTVSIGFAPSATGVRAGSISITSSAPGSPHSVTLAGTGVLTPTPGASLSTAALTFESQALGQTGTQTATLTNIGNAPLMIGAMALAGQNATEFRLGTSNVCTAGALAAAASCRVQVDFVPKSTGGKSATVTIAHNASGGSTALPITAAAAAPGGTTAPPTSSALVPSNVGGGGAFSPLVLALLAAFGWLVRRPTR